MRKTRTHRRARAISATAVPLDYAVATRAARIGLSVAFVVFLIVVIVLALRP